MRVVDVNLLVYAHRREVAEHEPSRRWLLEARQGDQRLGIADVVMSGFLRVVTNGRVFRDPTPFDKAVRFLERFSQGRPSDGSHPAIVIGSYSLICVGVGTSRATSSVTPGSRRWPLS